MRGVSYVAGSAMLLVRLIAPWSAFFVVLCITILLYQGFLTRDERHIEQAITDAAALVRSEITTRMDMRIVGLARLAQRWEDTGASSQSQWEAEATLNLRHFPGYHSIPWVEPSLRIRWLVSRETSQSPGDLRTVFSQYDQSVLQAAQARDTVTVLPVRNMPQGGKGFMVLVASQDGQDGAGFIAGL